MNRIGRLTILLGSIWVGAHLQAQVAETLSFLALDKAIPDGNAAGLSDVRTVNSSISTLYSVRLKLCIAGEFNGDLYGYVRHVGGGATNLCLLLNRPGRSSTNLNGYHPIPV